MNVKIADLMTTEVLTVEPHHTIDRVRRILQNNRIHALPVATSDGEVAGILSTKDLAADLNGATPVSEIMIEDVYTIPQYNDVHHAARLMINHKVSHVVVTHEKKIVGILSAFDLLQLVADRRFVAKQGPTPKKQRSPRQ
ncbi:MAG: CBS domain-containing protein [Acidobacteriota bacterium]